MYILFIVLIVIASVLLILAVLAQSPKSGMAANCFEPGNGCSSDHRLFGEIHLGCFDCNRSSQLCCYYRNVVAQPVAEQG